LAQETQEPTTPTTQQLPGHTVAQDDLVLRELCQLYLQLGQIIDRLEGRTRGDMGMTPIQEPVTPGQTEEGEAEEAAEQEAAPPDQPATEAYPDMTTGMTQRGEQRCLQFVGPTDMQRTAFDQARMALQGLRADIEAGEDPDATAERIAQIRNDLQAAWADHPQWSDWNLRLQQLEGQVREGSPDALTTFDELTGEFERSHDDWERNIRHDLDDDATMDDTDDMDDQNDMDGQDDEDEEGSEGGN
jgi:hypothetical protein